jgi:hypothetical protein
MTAMPAFIRRILSMRLRDRTNMIRRFYLGRAAVQGVGSGRVKAVQEAERTIEEGFRTLLVDRGVDLVTTYHEAGETDEAFEALRCGASALAVAAARLEPDRGAVDDRIPVAIETIVEPMYDELTARRLIAAFQCALGCYRRCKVLDGLKPDVGGTGLGPEAES